MVLRSDRNEKAQTSFCCLRGEIKRTFEKKKGKEGAVERLTMGREFGMKYFQRKFFILCLYYFASFGTFGNLFIFSPMAVQKEEDFARMGQVIFCSRFFLYGHFS